MCVYEPMYVCIHMCLYIHIRKYVCIYYVFIYIYT